MAKNPSRLSQRKTAASRQEQYVEATTLPDGQRDRNRPKFIKWLRGKFGMTVYERQGGKVTAEVKVGAPYQRVQHRPQARSHRG